MSVDRNIPLLPSPPAAVRREVGRGEDWAAAMENQVTSQLCKEGRGEGRMLRDAQSPSGQRSQPVVTEYISLSLFLSPSVFTSVSVDRDRHRVT